MNFDFSDSFLLENGHFSNLKLIFDTRFQERKGRTRRFREFEYIELMSLMLGARGPPPLYTWGCIPAVGVI